MRPAVLGCLLALLPASTADAAEPYCYRGVVTAYVRSEYGPTTYDGTPIGTSEAIAAAGWDIPLDSVVSVEGLGTYRVADRGMLGPGHIDVAVWTRQEAYAATGTNRLICVRPP